MTGNLCIHMASKKCPRQRGIFCSSYVCALDEGKLGKDSNDLSFLKDLFGKDNPFGFGENRSGER